MSKKKEDSGAVVRSLMVLGMTLVFIYTIFFGVHGEEIKQHTQALATQLQSDRQIAPTILNEIAPTEELLDTWNDPSDELEDSLADLQEDELVWREDDLPIEPNSPRPQDLPGRTFHSFQDLFVDSQVIESEMINLQGTRQREGFMKSLAATELDQYAQYILKDMDNTHYVFLGNYMASDLETTIISKWGNIVAIDDKNAISQHQLRGDKIVFINHPDFKGIKVLLLVFFEAEQDVRFMQIDQETYYAKKQEFGKLFEPWYSR